MSTNELEAVGITAMDESEVDAFLESQGVGVLGLPTGSYPYLLPLSFGYDGEGLCFTYVTGTDSEKETLSDRAGAASFLVFDARSRFAWQSVVLGGDLSAVPEDRWDALEEPMANAWRLDVFDTDRLDGGVSVYRFDVEERTGRKQTRLPPGFERDPSTG